MKYFVSTINFSSFKKRKISDVIPEMIDKGIKNIEISSLHPYEKDLDLTRYDANILIHNFAPPIKDDLLINLCSLKNSERVKNFIKERILFTKKLGNNYYSFHAGFRVDYLRAFHDYKDALTREQAMHKFVAELEDIIDFAEKENVHIGVENHVCIKENKNNLILYDINDWGELFRKVNSDYLHLHLDLGHLKISSNEHNFSRKQFIEKFGWRVMAVHVHENTGHKIDCHAPFDSFWMTKDNWSYLNNLEYITLETKTVGDIELINNMIDILKEDTG